jgi:hypothetical protein
VGRNMLGMKDDVTIINLVSYIFSHLPVEQGGDDGEATNGTLARLFLRQPELEKAGIFTRMIDGGVEPRGSVD